MYRYILILIIKSTVVSKKKKQLYILETSLTILIHNDNSIIEHRILYGIVLTSY